MNDPVESTRREFLRGEAARKELLRAAGGIGDDPDRSDSASQAMTEVPAAGDTIRLETRAMACPWCVIMNPGPPRQVMVASDALSEVHQVEDWLTVYRENSVIAEVNRRALDEPVPVSATLLEFLELCQRLTSDTDGAFDIAAGRLIDLWRSCRGEGRIPTSEEIKRTLIYCGMQHVVLDAELSTVKFLRAVKLDFAAIGKGWAIDRAVEHLHREGIEHALVHGGHSSLRAVGRHAEHSGWPVGIRNPLFTDKPFATVLLHDRALSSSGSNIQYFRYQGRKYGHILDPRSGWPTSDLLSATVLAESAAQADALSTALYVMGLDKAIDYCHHHPEVGAILFVAPGPSRPVEPVVLNWPPESFFRVGQLSASGRPEPLATQQEEQTRG